MSTEMVCTADAWLFLSIVGPVTLDIYVVIYHLGILFNLEIPKCYFA